MGSGTPVQSGRHCSWAGTDHSTPPPGLAVQNTPAWSDASKTLTAVLPPQNWVALPEQGDVQDPVRDVGCGMRDV